MEKIKKYLVDSDILIDYLRGDIKTRDFLFKLQGQGILMISVVNIVEIFSGQDIKDEKKKKIIEDFLNEFRIIILDENLAKHAGIVRMKYNLPFADSMIATTALDNDAVLVTRNIKHFSNIDGIELYSL